MKRRQMLVVLSILLLSQLGLTAAFLLSTKLQLGRDQPALLLFDKKKVTRVFIEDRLQDGKSDSSRKLSLLLTEKADWIMPDLYNFPASSELVHKTLDTLADLRTGNPLGQTSEACERYKVNGNNFRLAIILFAGDNKVGTIFIGKQLTAGTAAVRSNDEQSVYTAELPSSQMSANPSYWIDRRAVSTKLKKIASIEMRNFRLDNLDGKWNLVEGQRQDLLSMQVVQGLVYPAANCKIISVLGNHPDPDFDLEHCFLSCKIRLKDQSERTYKISRAKSTGSYVVSFSDLPWFCLADKRSVDKLRACTPESLRPKGH